MQHHRKLAASAAAGAASLLVGAAATVYACPSNQLSATTMTSALAAAGCVDACPPVDCAPGGSSMAGAGETGIPTGSRGGAGAIFDISIVDFSFTPNAPIVQPETTVRWTHTGIFPHTTTRVPTWDSGNMNNGDTFDVTFMTAGVSYDYVCTLHFGMEGTLSIARYGDANLDGLVNLADFNVLAASFGQSGRDWATGDFTNDGIVNLSDFNLLAGNFGREIEPAGLADLASFVPEPSWVTGAASVLLLAQSRRRRPAAA